MVKLNNTYAKKLQWRKDSDGKTPLERLFGSVDNYMEKVASISESKVPDGIDNELIGLTIRQHYFPGVDNGQIRYHTQVLQYSGMDIDQIVEAAKVKIDSGQYKLFVDGARDPNDGDSYVDDDCFIARNSEEAIRIVQRLGIPTVMHLDYHLGESKTIMEFLEWLYQEYVHKGDLVLDWVNHSTHPDRGQIDNLLTKLVWANKKANTQ